MKNYLDFVQEARDYAQRIGISVVVFQNTETNGYGVTSRYDYENHIMLVEPVIRLLLLMPDGRVVQ